MPTPNSHPDFSGLTPAEHAAPFGALGCGCVSLVAAACSEVAVSKATKMIQEWRLIYRLESQLFRAMWAEWVEGANVVTASALGKIPKSGPVEAHHLDKIRAALLKPITWPSPALTSLLDETLEEVWKLGSRAMLRRAMKLPGYQGQAMVYKADARLAIEPSFSTVDQEALAYLKTSQLYWLKNHYDADTLEAIRQAGMDEVLGMEGKDAAAVVRRHSDAAFGVGVMARAGKAYFEGVAVNASTTARVNSSIIEMAKIGVTKYEIMNPMDERTSPVCRFMNGKVLEVREAVDQIAELVAAKDPDAVRSIHPWLGGKFNEALASNGATLGKNGQFSNPSGVKAAGLALPPYHMRCRSTVDISEHTEFLPQTGSSPEAILSQMILGAL